MTFFPKPKKVTKEGFALRLALLARGGRWVDGRLLVVIKIWSGFVFAAELLWWLFLCAGAVVATGRRVENQTMNTECSRGLSYRTQPLFRLASSKKQGPVFVATQHKRIHQPL